MFKLMNKKIITILRKLFFSKLALCYAIICVNVNMTRARVPPDMAYTCTINLYGKCSKILNTSHFPLSTRILAIRDGIDKMFVRIANREDPDQTASSEAV